MLGTRKQARLPAGMETPTVDQMTVGQISYVVPWAMWVDDERRCWLHPKYSVSGSPHGTASMLIQRTVDGYEVWPQTAFSNWRGWKPENKPGYIGGEGLEYLPVIELHGDEFR